MKSYKDRLKAIRLSVIPPSVARAFSGRTVQWTANDQSLALKRGWALFVSDGRMVIRRSDTKGRFENDAAALLHVQEQAILGDSHAARALIFMARAR